MSAPRALTGLWLGRRSYAPTYELQCALMELRKADAVGDLALMLEHHPVITLGRGAVAEHLLESRESLVARGIEVESTDRGGEITLHAPGQLVCYPIVRLSPDRCDVRRYVRDLMYVMQSMVAGYHISAGESAVGVGLWVNGADPEVFCDAAPGLQKIGAIGVRISRWVTMHGFALNLCPDLSLYRAIVPCGIRDFGVCSVESLRGDRAEPQSLAATTCLALCERLERQLATFVDLGECAQPQLLSRVRQLAR